MASAFTHAIAGVAIGTALGPRHVPARFWVICATAAALPDVDGVGFWLGVPYESAFGHRGFTHSLFFAALFASIALLAFRDKTADARPWRLWLAFFLATASHGVLDAMTTGGGGIAFFAPFVNERYFLPWRPILVSPMSVRRFFSARGMAILASELVWVWLPAAVVAGTALLLRRRQAAPVRERAATRNARPDRA
jgi:inner membrane protein